MGRKSKRKTQDFNYKHQKQVTELSFLAQYLKGIVDILEGNMAPAPRPDATQAPVPNSDI